MKTSQAELIEIRRKAELGDFPIVGADLVDDILRLQSLLAEREKEVERLKKDIREHLEGKGNLTP